MKWEHSSRLADLLQGTNKKMVSTLAEYSADVSFSCQRDAFAPPVPSEYIPHKDEGTALWCTAVIL